MKKVAVITGASSGIGKELAIFLAKDYKHLFLCGRNEDTLKETGRLIQSDSLKLEYIILDLSSKESIESATSKIREQTKQVHLLVNNAGISQRSLASETSEEVEMKLMQVNYFGPVLFTKKLLPLLRNTYGARIAVTSSIVGKFGFFLRSTYSAAKHALHGFFESLRLEEIKNDVFVQLFVIGRVQTQVSVNAMTATGNKYGKMDNGQADGISAEKCAQKINLALKSDKKEVLIGGKEILMVRLKKYLPFMFYRIAEKEANHV